MAQLGQQLQRAEADAIRWTTQTTLEQAQCEALLQQLPVAWHAFDDVSPLSVEFAQLQARNIPEEFHALQQEAILLEDWQRQARELEGELAAVPESCRVTVAQAEANLQLAEQAYRQAEADHREAEGQHSRFLQQIQDIQKLNEEIKQAEEAERLHKTLDQLLGKDGLQRELMREAEQAIISMAQQTLDHLSLGELSIALAETETGPDRAFDLAVRSGENTTPTSVKMLSGSQKFRVAISIALAIGRFASGQARPLECVIIDEGFGSLDKEGLRTTADELNRLKGLLKRIILVSHQDEFTERFPAMIRLSKGEQGTTAEAIRHRG
jgi:DNA repair exonuclease SbcCD ATPase subunit